MTPKAIYVRDDEQAMAFAGFLLFFDPPKPGVKDTISDLAELGVQLKIITGDNKLVAPTHGSGGRARAYWRSDGP